VEAEGLAWRRRILPLIAVIVLMAVFFVSNYSFAEELVKQDLGYISDEVWYVSASRNMLREFWNLTPKAEADGRTYATVVVWLPQHYRGAYDRIVRAEGLSAIVKDDYDKYLRDGWNGGFAVLASRNLLEEVDRSPNVKVYFGYPYPDHAGIINYLNLEHPPLAKYFLAGIMLLDDKPLAWKIPSLILSLAVMFLAYLVAKQVFGPVEGIVAAVFIFTEQTVKAMSMVAMLDIYLAFFTLLALYLAVRFRSVWPSSLALGLAVSVKMSGAFAIVALLVSSFRRGFLRRFPLVILVPLAVYAAISMPVILYFGGVWSWINNVRSALSWYTTPRPAGPPTATPIEFLFGGASFPLSFNPPLSASPNLALTLLVIPLTILLAPLALKGVLNGVGTILAWFWSIYFGYAALFLVGNTTLYAFYAVQFMPVAAVIGSSVVTFIFRHKLAFEALKAYAEIFRRKRGSKLEVEFQLS
jgi:predicted membrane-bound dolichyl-phosphate-mannose-protein mannosyltransferase